MALSGCHGEGQDSCQSARRGFRRDSAACGGSADEEPFMPGKRRTSGGGWQRRRGVPGAGAGAAARRRCVMRRGDADRRAVIPPSAFRHLNRHVIAPRMAPASMPPQGSCRPLRRDTGSDREKNRPVARYADCGTACSTGRSTVGSTVTASRNGIIARSRAPTSSIWCCRSACCVAVNRGRPARSSAIHAFA